MKGICPKCKKIIDVDNKDELIKCPNCNEEILVNEAVKTYTNLIVLLAKKGDLAYNYTTNYKVAYENYYKLNELKNTDLDYMCKLVLACLFNADLHNPSYIDKAIDHLVKGSDNITIDTNNINTLSSYLIKIRNDICFAIRYYDRYKLESAYCYNNYLSALKSYIRYLNYYKEIYNALDKLNEYLDDSLDFVDEEINKTNTLIDAKVTLKSDNLNKHDILNEKNKVVTSIFNDHQTLYKSSTILYIASAVGAVISIVGLILLANKANQVATFVVLGIGLLFFFGGYFIGHYLRDKLKKLKSK